MCVDDNGAPYTEYLMRCQWGTSFENMQPWIVAHRYKEFDILDHQIRREYSLLASSLVPLPKKVPHSIPFHRAPIMPPLSLSLAGVVPQLLCFCFLAYYFAVLCFFFLVRLIFLKSVLFIFSIFYFLRRINAQSSFKT